MRTDKTDILLSMSLLRGEVRHGIDSLQDLHCWSQSVVVSEPHVLIELLPRSVLVVDANTRPVETAVTASSPVTVLQTVVESSGKISTNISPGEEVSWGSFNPCF